MGIVATGIKLEFTNYSGTFMAEVIDVTPPGMSREMVDMSHQQTSKFRVFKPGRLIDPGQAEANIAFDPTEVPPIDEDFDEVKITYPDDAATEWTFQGALQNYEPTGNLEEKMTADVTIKASGPISINGSVVT